MQFMLTVKNIINNLILKHYGRKKRREVADARRHQGD